MRRRRADRRDVIPDPKFNNKTISRFVNMLMEQGKKWNAEKIVYGSLEMVAPKTSRRSGGNRDAALLLLLHPVHRGRAFVHFAHAMHLAGVVKHALGRGRLARVDMCGNAEISGFL